MKLFFKCLSVIILCIASSCSKHADLVEYVPGDATGVVCFDLRSLLESAGALEGDAVTMNNELRYAIEDTRLRLLPVLLGDNGGKRALSLDGRAYFFTAASGIDYAWLFEISDDDAARATIEKLTAKKFDTSAGAPMIYDAGTLYVMLNDNALMIAMSDASEDAIRSAAVEIVERKHDSLLESNAAACKAIDGDAAVRAYFKPEGLRTVLAALPRLLSPEIIAQFDIMPLLAVGAGEDVTMSIDVSDKAIVLSGELAQAKLSRTAYASDVLLKSIPAEMTRVTLFNNAGVGQLPPDLLSSLDKTGVFDCLPRDSIVKHITGPVAVATETNPSNVHIEGPNYTVVATCDDVYTVIDLIYSFFVDQLGQEEEGKNDELIFQLGARPVTIGLANDSVLYLNVLDFQRSGKKFGDDAARAEYLNKSVVATDASLWRGRWGGNVTCRIMPGGKIEAKLTSNKNAVVSWLGILCEASQLPVTVDDIDE